MACLWRHTPKYVESTDVFHIGFACCQMSNTLASEFRTKHCNSKDFEKSILIQRHQPIDYRRVRHSGTVWKNRGEGAKKTMIGVAVIGAGRIGRIHARNVSDNDNARIIYVCDVVADAAAELANRCGGKAASVDRILVDENVGAVIIASSTDTHAELIEQAAAAGKAIFCEKPLDLDVQRARASVEIAKKSNVLLCLGFNRRHDPDFEKLKAEANSGSIGTIEVVSIVSRDPSPPPPEYVQRSGGLFRDMMIHDLDMGRWLLGEEPSQLFAAGSALADPKIEKLGDIDTAVAVLRTASGRLCQITNSRRCCYGYDQRIEVFGSEGMVRADNQKNTQVEKATTGGFTTEPALPFFLERYAKAYRIQLDRFIHAVGGHRVDLPLGLYGLRALELAEAAQESLETGRAVEISYAY